MSAQAWLTIASPELMAQIDPLGAQLSILRDAQGRDLLWHGDANVWAGRAPVLFPIVGMLNGGGYRLGERSFPLSRHGFARGKPFELIGNNASSALFRLRADESTRSVYPFEFELDLSFAVARATLLITATVRNAGDEPMPANLGFHPGFRWPLPYGEPRDRHYIEFEQPEPGAIRRIDATGLLKAESHPTPIIRRRLALTDELFEPDVLILDDLRSRSVTYGAAAGPRLQIDFPDATHLGLWTRSGAGFVCIEPWRGVTDPSGFTGDIRVKPGIFTVLPGASETLTMSTTLLPT